MLKKGFTLVEMIVVIGILAILTLISASAMMASRNQSTLDKAVQELVMTIREAQSNSIAVKQGQVTNTKVWGVKIEGGSGTNQKIKLINYTFDSVNNKLTYNQERVIDSYNSAGIKFYPHNSSTMLPSETTASIDAYVSYAAPFGTPYLYGFDISNNTGCANSPTSALCRWNESTKPSKEWFLTSGLYTTGLFANSKINQPHSLKVKVSHRGFSRMVVIESSGDVYVE